MTPASPHQYVRRRGTDKVTETNTHVFFVSGPYSQWHMSSFTQRLEPDGPEVLWDCAERYMMAGKAHLFGDLDMMEKIMAYEPRAGEPWIKIPSSVKKMGRDVRGFKEEVWYREACPIVFRGNFARFTQNLDLLKYLMDDEGKTLVEASANDRVWGVGLAWDDPAVLDFRNWRGTNWLGQVHNAVQRAIRHCADVEIAFEDFPLWPSEDVWRYFVDVNDRKA